MKPKYFLIAAQFIGAFITTNPINAMDYSEKVALCNDYAIGKINIFSSTTNYEKQQSFNYCMTGDNAEKILRNTQLKRQRSIERTNKLNLEIRRRKEEERRQKESKYQDALNSFR